MLRLQTSVMIGPLEPHRCSSHQLFLTDARPHQCWLRRCSRCSLFDATVSLFFTICTHTQMAAQIACCSPPSLLVLTCDTTHCRFSESPSQNSSIVILTFPSWLTVHCPPIWLSYFFIGCLSVFFTHSQVDPPALSFRNFEPSSLNSNSVALYTFSLFNSTPAPTKWRTKRDNEKNCNGYSALL